MNETTTATGEVEIATFVDDGTGGKSSRAYTGFCAGEFLGHITGIRTQIVDTKLGQRARVYNFSVLVDDANRTMQYNHTDNRGVEHTIPGETYIGKKLVADGVFKFLDPQDGEDFKANPSGNDRYMRFCETLGVKPKEEKTTLDGKEVTLKHLPNLTEDDLLGKPVIGVQALSNCKPWTDKSGNTHTKGWRVKFVKTWENGKAKDMSFNPADDLPF